MESSNAPEEDDAAASFMKNVENTIHNEIIEIKSLLESISTVDHNDDNVEKLKALRHKCIEVQNSINGSLRHIPFSRLARDQQKLLALRRQIETSYPTVTTKGKFTFNRNKTTAAKGKLRNIATDAGQTEIKQTAEPSEISDEKPNVITIKDSNYGTFIYGPFDCEGKDCSLVNLLNCEIYLLDFVGAARIQNLRNCTVWIAMVGSSTFISDCEECTFIIVSKQVRVYGSMNLTLYLQTLSSPVIEKCNGIAVAPYNFQYSERNMDAERKLSAFENAIKDAPNLWYKVLDFDWQKQKASPHWHTLPEEKRIPTTHVLLEKITGDSYGHLDNTCTYASAWKLKGIPHKLKIPKKLSAIKSFELT